ncbi:hypothetical protein EVC37_21925 [Methylocaldum sp. BRCS4]|jgi:type IV secretion system protein VirB1|uniref:lytic transglycosylase domain-containing protein n=1 Tax=Methylocaldum sp. GT1BW TaxID=3438964 RepID=UPI0012EB4414|nr:hypothetical protein [Methylocaldum sp. BRCS4]
MIPDIPVLLHECAPSAHHQVLNALIKTESGGNPFAIYDNSSRSSVKVTNAEDAVAKADALIRQGHSVDMGLGQINSRNLSRLGLSVRQIFDPCTNIKAASTVWEWGLKKAIEAFGEGEKATLAAMSVYNTGSLSAGFANGYVRRAASNLGIKVHLTYPDNNNQGGIASPYNAPLAAHFFPNTDTAEHVSNPRFSQLTAAGF